MIYWNVYIFVDNKNVRYYRGYHVNYHYNVNGAVPKWLRERSAKPLFTGSNPVGASFLPL